MTAPKQDKGPLGHAFEPCEACGGDCCEFFDGKEYSCHEPASAHKAEEAASENNGPANVKPYVPDWCYEEGARICACNDHEGFHDDSGSCLRREVCGCAGAQYPAPEPADKAGASHRAEFEAKAMELAADTLLNLSAQEFESRREKIVAIIRNSAAWLRAAETAARAEGAREALENAVAMILHASDRPITQDDRETTDAIVGLIHAMIVKP
jgi:hypothetical protein